MFKCFMISLPEKLRICVFLLETSQKDSKHGMVVSDSLLNWNNKDFAMLGRFVEKIQSFFPLFKM